MVLKEKQPEKKIRAETFNLLYFLLAENTAVSPP